MLRLVAGSLRILLFAALLAPSLVRAEEATAGKEYPCLLGIPLKPTLTVLQPDLKAQAWGFIDPSGKVIVPPTWDYVGPFWHGMATVSKDGKWGIIDATGKIILKPEWDEILAWTPNGRFTVKRDGKCLLVDSTGKPLGPALCDMMERGEPSEGLVRVWKDNKVGYADMSGKAVIAPAWDAGFVFQEGLAGIVRGGKEGFIDPTGKVVIDLQWDYDPDCNNFSEGLAAVKKDGKWGFIDKSGKIVIPIEWDHARPFLKGLAQVEKNKKWGFIDPMGHEVVPVQWDYACLFSDGLSMVVQNEKHGYVDATGKVVLPPQWKSASLFVDGLAAVEVDGKCGFIDKSGQLLIPPAWDLIPGGADDMIMRKGRIIVYKNGHYGVIDTQGKILIPPEWDNIEYQPPYFNDGFFTVRFADHSFKMPTIGEINSGLNGRITPEMEAREKLWRTPQPAEAAWFDYDGKMIWHSTP